MFSFALASRNLFKLDSGCSALNRKAREFSIHMPHQFSSTSGRFYRSFTRNKFKLPSQEQRHTARNPHVRLLLREKKKGEKGQQKSSEKAPLTLRCRGNAVSPLACISLPRSIKMGSDASLAVPARCIHAHYRAFWTRCHATRSGSLEASFPGRQSVGGSGSIR